MTMRLPRGSSMGLTLLTRKNVEHGRARNSTKTSDVRKHTTATANKGSRTLAPVNTSVQVWLGIRLDLANNIFWAGCGRRNLNGVGLCLMEQTEDNARVTTFLPVYSYPQLPPPGQFTIRKPSG